EPVRPRPYSERGRRLSRGRPDVRGGESRTSQMTHQPNKVGQPATIRRKPWPATSPADVSRLRLSLVAPCSDAPCRRAGRALPNSYSNGAQTSPKAIRSTRSEEPRLNSSHVA